MKISQIIIKDLIKSRLNNPADLNSFKRKVSKKYKIPCPSNIELLKAYHEFLKKKMDIPSDKIKNLLKTRPIRSLSGIVNVSVLTKPYPCPAKCIFCPTEKGIPKSYLSGEPAVERAKKLNYDPYLQVKKRIEMLELEGHPTDKIELRIVGGTWSFYPEKYQDWFIKKCFDAGNQKASKNLGEAQKLNEKAKYRIVGISIETRPDYIAPPEIKRLRNLGVNLVELGIQSIYDDVLSLNLRDHGVKEIISATKLLKDAGFKVLYQMMLNLPGSDLKKDKKMFADLFQKLDFQPDLLKIYPCALLKEAPLYFLWKRKKIGYKPYGVNALINLIKTIKKEIPYYVRIQRIARDIPSQRIIEGPAKILNIRQIIKKQAKGGWPCRCIRCREVKENYSPKERLYLFREDYPASNGEEIFLSFENKDRTKLYSLLRLRAPFQHYENNSRSVAPALENSAIIREIHTYGQLLPIYGGLASVSSENSPQHRGLGKKLVREAERISKKEFGSKKVAVISGIGVRDYYRKLGYKLKDTYMIKKI